MSTEITMPSLGPNVEAGNLLRWLVREGATVRAGEPIAEVETDKVTMEVEATGSGVLARLLFADGTERIKVGEVLALLAQPGEHLEAAARRDVPASRDSRRIKASPIARRLARAQGIDLFAVTGSGPGGRIVKTDIEKLAPSAPAATASKPAAPSAPHRASVGSVANTVDAPHEIVQLSNMRKTIARRLAGSKATVPHFYLSVDIRLDALLKLRSEFEAATAVKLSINDLLIKALGIALTRVPDANVQFADQHLLKFHRADVSVAVAVPGGLVTPVIRDVARKSMTAVATEMKELVDRARNGKLAPAEYQGGSASLSNLGMYGIKQFDAVINPPQAAIVAVGAGERRVVAESDEMRVATVMCATGSFDHRAIDGAVGAELMSAFRRAVEQPLSLLA